MYDVGKHTMYERVPELQLRRCEITVTQLPILIDTPRNFSYTNDRTPIDDRDMDLVVPLLKHFVFVFQFSAGWRDILRGVFHERPDSTSW